MNKRESIEDRMKHNYENRSKTYLTRKVPVIIRLDGRAFHTLTRGLKRPYDELFHKAMNETMKCLCKNIQGCKIGYTQSDEITLLLTDFDTITTDAWFDFSVQKMCSISASMATLAFNKYFQEFSEEVIRQINSSSICKEKDAKYEMTLKKIRECGAMFDARCFNIPETEIVNCFIWRQQDATRNAIQMLAQTYFSQKTLDGKSVSDLHDMLMLEKGINFNDMPIEFKRGVCCVKREVECTDRLTGKKIEWVIDKEIPIFTKDRTYIEKTYEVMNERV